MGRTKLPSEVWLRVIAVERGSGAFKTYFGSLRLGERLSHAAAQVLGSGAHEPVFKGLASVSDFAHAGTWLYVFTLLFDCTSLSTVGDRESSEEDLPFPAALLLPAASSLAASSSMPTFCPVEDRQVGGGGGVFSPSPRLPLDLVVFVVLINPQHEVVMVRESKSSCRGQLFLPAGHVEPGETVHEAAERELREETFLALDHTSLRIADVVYGGGHRYSPLHFVVIAEAISLGRLKVEAEADSESMDAIWLPISRVLAGCQDPEQQAGFRNPEEVSYVLETAAARYSARCLLPLQSVPKEEPSRRCRVLVVDSSFSGGGTGEAPALLDISSAGWEVCVFEETAELLETFRADAAAVAAVVTSRMVSSGRLEAGLMSGAALLAQVRAEGPRPFPVLCMSSATLTEVEAREAGADCLVRSLREAEGILQRALGARANARV